MKSFRSLRFQTAAIIVVAFFISHLAGYLIYSLDRKDALEMTEAIDLAERAAGVSRLVRDLPPSLKRDIVEYSDSRIFRVWLSSEPAVPEITVSDVESEILTYLRSQVPRIAKNEMRVSFLSENPGTVIPPPFDSANRAGSPASADDLPAIGSGLAISMRHADAEWINFLGTFGTPKSLLPELFLANLASAIVGVALVAFWLVERVTSPLGRFARAAEDLGRDLFRSPLAVDGPREVAVAAIAFNRMQLRLSRLIQNRTEFLAAISHDLRTPLTQMRLRLEAMPNTRDNGKMLQSIEDMDVTIGSFLSYARAVNDAEKRSKIDLGALVNSLCDDLEENGHDIGCNAPPKLILECKRVAIKRALSNLIDNALKYGGCARVAAFQRDRYLVVQIDDDGPGIPDADLQTALKPFQRLAYAGKGGKPSGSGLGLSIALAIMEDHGGELSVSNRPGGGLRVELLFPI
jgi:signal transduction histidine kinase